MAVDQILEGTISLNGVIFPIKGDVQPQDISQFPGKTMIGDSSRSDQQNVSEWNISDLRGGIGIENMNERQDLDRFRDSYGVWTLDAKGIHLGPLVSDLAAALPVVSWSGTAFGYFNGALFVSSGLNTYRWNGSSFDVVVANSFYKMLTYTNAAGTKRVYIFHGDSYSYSTTGAVGAWTTVSGAGDHFIDAVEFDRKLVAFHAGNGGLYYTTDGASGTWTCQIANLPNISGALLVTRDPATRDEIILFGCAEAVYSVDFWTGSVEKYIDFGAEQYGTNGWGMISYRDEVYIPNYHNLLKVSGTTIQDIGLGREDGLEVPLDAKVKTLAALSDMIFGATIDSLWVWNGRGWHCMARDTSTTSWNRDVLVKPFTQTDTLIRVYYNKVDKTVGQTIRYFDLPLQGRRPIKTTGFTFCAAGSLFTPYFDGYFSEWDKVATGIKLRCSGMSATETIVVKYRIDANTSWTTLGTVTANGATTLSFASGAGLTFKKIQLEFDFARGSTATLTPVMESAVLRWYLAPDLLQAWRVTLDCTHECNGLQPSELLAALDTAKRTDPMVVFAYYPGGDKNVKILSGAGRETTGINRTGLHNIVLAELG